MKTLFIYLFDSFKEHFITFSMYISSYLLDTTPFFLPHSLHLFPFFPFPFMILILKLLWHLGLFFIIKEWGKADKDKPNDICIQPCILQDLLRFWHFYCSSVAILPEIFLNIFLLPDISQAWCTFPWGQEVVREEKFPPMRFLLYNMEI